MPWSLSHLSEFIAPLKYGWGLEGTVLQRRQLQALPICEKNYPDLPQPSKSYYFHQDQGGGKCLAGGRAC